MPRNKTSRRSKGGKTRRVRRGGSEDKLREIIDSVPMKANLTVNPSSKFVVATYWWGRGRMNANLQGPCPEDITDEAKEILEEELMDDDPSYKTEIFEPFDKMAKSRKAKLAAGGLTKDEVTAWKAILKKRLDFLNSYFAKPDIKKRLTTLTQERIEVYRKDGTFREPKTYDAMIQKWEQVCQEMNCNYLSVEYPQFAVPGGYQLAINAKPLFIKKALSATEGRGVLYIDGDMFIRKYPKIFDMPNIDFAARSWNFDPRSSARFKEDICFDPYMFETSGGTMFFGNTPMSNQLLDTWAKESSLPKNAGKADDRILSQVFTVQKFAPKTNTLHLPIEYLWLTDLFANYDFQGAAAETDCIIDHPYCLTGEERAAEMSESTVDRQPPGYDAQLGNLIECNTHGGTFYEYIYFPKQDMVDSFGPYLKYMKDAVNPATEEKVFEVVDFSDRYGRYSAIALKNLADARAVKLESLGATATELKLPLMPPVKNILAGLLKGLDVFIGSEPRPLNIEFAGRNIGTALDPYLANIQLDHSSSMYISGKNPIIMHLLAMCKTLEDVNIHLKESFMFLSRIRWSLRKAGEEAMRIPGLAKKQAKSMEMF